MKYAGYCFIGNFEKLARPERFELPTARFVVRSMNCKLL